MEAFFETGLESATRLQSNTSSEEEVFKVLYCLKVPKERRGPKKLPGRVHLCLLEGASAATAELIGTSSTLEMHASSTSQLIPHVAVWTFWR